MTIIDRFHAFTLLDLVAVLGLFGGWLAIGYWIENSSNRYPSVSHLMADYRREWMVHHLTREPRVFDAMVLTNLRQGTTFFASGCMIAIGGALALIGNPEPLLGVARDLSLDQAPLVVWEVKLLTVILFLSMGFLNFVWSHRLFGYNAVVMGAIPNESDTPRARHRAEQAALLNISASRSFNRGLRATYFALAGLAWLLGPLPLLVTSGATLVILWRREFASHSRKVLLDRGGEE